MAVKFIPIDTSLGINDFSDIYDTLEQGRHIGQRAKGFSPVLGQGEFILLKGASGLTAGDAVIYNGLTGDVFETTDATHKNTGASIAFALVSNTSATKYSWYQIQGNAVGNADAAVVANTPVYIKTTAGNLDDAVVAGGQVLGARFATVRGATVNGQTLLANELIVSVNYPTIQGGAAV